MKLYIITILFSFIIQINNIKSLTPIKLEPFQKYKIEHKKQILFQFDNIILKPDILTDIVIYYKREKDKDYNDNFTCYIVKNINDIYNETKNSTIKQIIYRTYFTKKFNYLYEIRQDKKSTINSGNGTYYIFFSGLITGEFEIFNIQNIKKITPYYSFNVNYLAYNSGNNVTLSLGDITENIKLQYQINSGNISLIKNNNENNEIINNGNNIGIFDLEKGGKYYLLFNLGKKYGNLYGNFYKEDLEILNEGNSIEKMGENIYIDFIINMTKINDTYLLCETNDDFDIFYKFYDTIDKEEIKKKYPEKKEDFDYNLTKSKFENLEKITKDSENNLCVLIRLYYTNRIYVKFIPKPTQLNTDKKEIIKKNTLYFYSIDFKSKNETKEYIIYVSESSGIKIYSNVSQLNNLRDYPRKLYKIKKETNIVLYNKDKDFNFEIKFYPYIEDYGDNERIINEKDFFIEKRIELNDCNKNYFFFYFTDTNFIIYPKLIKGDSNIYTIKDYNDDLNIEDIYPMSSDKQKLIENQHETKENFLVLKLKCNLPSIIDIYIIKDDFVNYFTTSSTRYIYLRENEYVNFSLKFYMAFELIADKDQKEQNIIVKVNQTDNNINKNNLNYYFTEEIQYFNYIQIISTKGNNILILRGGLNEDEGIIVDDTYSYKYKMKNVFVFPKNDKTIKEVNIKTKLLNQEKILLFLYNNYGKKPFYDISFFDAEKYISKYNNNYNITIKNPYNDLGKRELSNDEYYYHYIFGNTIKIALLFTYEIVREIRVYPNFFEVLKPGINNFSIDIKNKKQFVYQINKCQSENVDIILNETENKYRNFRYNTSKFIIESYLIDKQTEITLSINSLNETLFKYINFEKELQYTFNPTDNYNITIEISNSTNEIKLNYEAFLKNEKTEYNVIISRKIDINETLMNDECYLYNLIEHKKAKIIVFEDDGKNNNITKEIEYEFEYDDIYYINIFALQKENYKIMATYNNINFYHKKVEKFGFLFFLFLCLIIALLIMAGVSMYFFCRKKDLDEKDFNEIENEIDSFNQL